MNMVDWLQSLTATDDSYIIALLAAILIASTIDFLFGWLNARLNPNVSFKSGEALYGIIKKMMYFVVLTLFMGVAYLIVPEAVALPSIYALYIGYLVSEIHSILAHLNMTDDGKKGELFATFIKRLLKGEGTSGESSDRSRD